MSQKISAATRLRARISHCSFILAGEVEHSLPTATMNEDYSRTSMPLMATSLQLPLFGGRTVHTWTLLQTSKLQPLSLALCSRCGGGSTVPPSRPSKDYHARNFLSNIPRTSGRQRQFPSSSSSRILILQRNLHGNATIVASTPRSSFAN